MERDPVLEKMNARNAELEKQVEKEKRKAMLEAAARAVDAAIGRRPDIQAPAVVRSRLLDFGRWTPDGRFCWLGLDGREVSVDDALAADLQANPVFLGRLQVDQEQLDAANRELQSDPPNGRVSRKPIGQMSMAELKAEADQELRAAEAKANAAPKHGRALAEMQRHELQRAADRELEMADARRKG